LDELISSLLKAGYLITPPAYYVLKDAYERGKVSLVEIVKVTKSKGRFVVTEDIALSLVSRFNSTKTEEKFSEDFSFSSINEDIPIIEEREETKDSEEPEGWEENTVISDISETLLLDNVDESNKLSSTFNHFLYSDLEVKPNPYLNYVSASVSSDYSIVSSVGSPKFRQYKNGNGKDGEILVESYRSLFLSRYRKLRRILRENPEIGGVVDIGKLHYVSGEDEVTIVGMIVSKRSARNGYILELEDRTGQIKVYLRNDLLKDVPLMMGAVVAVRGELAKNRKILFANRLYLPDVPVLRTREHEPLKEKIYAVLASDLHVGSKKFCEDAFIRFLEWLNGNEGQEEIVERIKYLVLNGDVVDGVGIYPGQRNELAIPDIFEQYEALANLLKNVPKHITVFIGPGNHDAARTALPQPGFYEEYARPLYKLKNAVIISNPAVINLHGREFLIAHGRGIEDVVNQVPGRTHHKPAEAMIELLKLRHLAPTFGGKVPIAPDPEDTLIIDSVPDLFTSGHVHVMEYKIYNGVFVINTGTWQAQTEFQKMVNIVPTPARVPIIDVETARLRAVVSFEQFCEGV